MAIYHLSVKHGSRKQGKSAAAHANYIAREGTYAKGRYVEDFVHAESWNMPDWGAENAIDFWQAADTYERANGRLYTEIEIALPRELGQAQQLSLVRDFVSEQVGDEHPVTWAVHNRPALDGGMNPHAHIMLSERTLDGVERNPELFFKRANAANPEKGGAAKDPAWNHRDKVEQLRQAWKPPPIASCSAPGRRRVWIIAACRLRGSTARLSPNWVRSKPPCCITASLPRTPSA